MTHYLYIMRHGQCEDNKLTEKSEKVVRSKAEEIRKDLESLSAIVIYHSPIPKAVITAEVVKEELTGINVTLEPRKDLAPYQYGLQELIDNLQNTSIIIAHQEEIQFIAGYCLKNGEYRKIILGKIA